MKDIKKAQAGIILGGLVMFLIVIDSQCYFQNEACLPDFGYTISAPNVLSDQDLLLTGLANHTINKEWKEKPGEVYGVITSKNSDRKLPYSIYCFKYYIAFGYICFGSKDYR